MTAFLLSFAVPGLGHWYAGAPGAAKLYITSELLVWGGYFFSSSLKSASRDDYLRYATIHAGVNPAGQGSSYLGALSAYDSSFDYNRAQDQGSKYPEYYDGPQAWDWDSYDNRDRFKQLREKELDYENYAKYCVAGMFLNHFLAGLNASKLVRESAPAGSAVRVHPTHDGIAANYSWRF